MQDAIRQGKILSFFLMKRKESLIEQQEEGRKRGEGGGRVRGRRCLTFFQRYYKLSECAYFWLLSLYVALMTEREWEKVGGVLLVYITVTLLSYLALVNRL